MKCEATIDIDVDVDPFTATAPPEISAALLEKLHSTKYHSGSDVKQQHQTGAASVHVR